MPLAARHRDDRVAPFTALAGLSVRRETDVGVMAALQGRTAEDMLRRFDGGHRAYVAQLDGADAAWGWVATRSAEIGELGATFTLPDGERYLWNFVTLATHRGRGIYPRLIEAIIAQEPREAERFWIAYAPENHASGSGIIKAGFLAVAELSFDAEGRPAVHELVAGGGRAAAHVLGLPEARTGLAPCWRCVRAGRGAMSCPPGACECDYQQPHSGCAA